MNKLAYDPNELETVKRNGRVYYKAPCLNPECGRIRELRRSDLDSPICIQCQRLLRSRKGFNAQCEHFGGYRAMMYQRAEHMRNNPTSPEVVMMSILDGLGVKYEAQQPIFYDRFGIERCYIIDFVVNPGVFVEVNGVYWHSKNERSDRDARLMSLCNERGIQLVFVTDEQLANAPSTVETSLMNLCGEHK